MQAIIYETGRICLGFFIIAVSVGLLVASIAVVAYLKGVVKCD